MCLERGELNADKFKTNIKNALGIEDKDIIDNGDGTWTIKFKGTDINTGEKVPFGPGVLVAETENEEWIDKDGDKAIIPGGYGIMPGLDDVSEGLVITDNFENDGNEFVWIPVETAVAGSETQGTTTKAMAVNMGTEENPKYRGLLYNFDANGSNVISGCTDLTSTSNREPAILSDYDTDTKTYLKGIGLTQESFQTEMQEAYKDMIKSVSINHGFYVSRYEMSLDESGNAQSKKLQPSATNNSASANMWYGLYDKAKNYAKKDSGKSVVSSMIWGSQYDAMMNWMQKGRVKVESTTPVTGAVRNQDTERKTGAVEKDQIKKVYDLLGNSSEWTLEAYSSDCRVLRGGNCYDSHSPANRYGDGPNNSSSNYDLYSTRLALYIK